MANTEHCYQYLLGTAKSSDWPEIVAAVGDDAFLRRETVHKLLQQAGIDADAVRNFDGNECQWIDVHDELATLSLFADNSRRVAVVQNADRLIKSFRTQLENWVSSPAQDSLLILQVDSLPSNTKLFKAIAKSGLCIKCTLPTSSPRSKTPSMSELKKWVVAWAKQEHDLTLNSTHAALIMDAVGTDSGLLHQELAKLALYAEGGKLNESIIEQHVGSLRTRTAWEIADAIVEQNVPFALECLQRLLAAGEHPAAIVPQVSWSLRRYAKAAALASQSQRNGKSVNTRNIISQCGFFGADAAKAEGKLKKLGLKKASAMLAWLLELDLKLKGSHSTPARATFALEEFCLRFAD